MTGGNPTAHLGGLPGGDDPRHQEQGHRAPLGRGKVSSTASPKRMAAPRPRRLGWWTVLRSPVSVSMIVVLCTSSRYLLEELTVARPRTSARTVDHPDLDDVPLQQVLEALVDPVRRIVVFQLDRKGADMSCGTFDAPVALSTLTHHFNVLREAGIIRQYYVGTMKMNTLRVDEMEERFPGLLTSVLAACAADPRVPGASAATPAGP